MQIKLIKKLTVRKENIAVKIIKLAKTFWT